MTTKTAERLNAMSLQEIFDFVNDAITKQGKSSYSESLGDCAYRGPDGLKCAAGMLLDDEDYDRGLEGAGASDMCNAVGFRAPVIEVNEDGEDVEVITREHPITVKRDLLRRLQSAHDNAARCAMDGETKFIDAFTQKMEHVKSWLNSLPLSR